MVALGDFITRGMPITSARPPRANMGGMPTRLLSMNCKRQDPAPDVAGESRCTVVWPRIFTLARQAQDEAQRQRWQW